MRGRDSITQPPIVLRPIQDRGDQLGVNLFPTMNRDSCLEFQIVGLARVDRGDNSASAGYQLGSLRCHSCREGLHWRNLLSARFPQVQAVTAGRRCWTAVFRRMSRTIILPLRVLTDDFSGSMALDPNTDIKLREHFHGVTHVGGRTCRIGQAKAFHFQHMLYHCVPGAGGNKATNTVLARNQRGKTASVAQAITKMGSRSRNRTYSWSQKPLDTFKLSLKNRPCHKVPLAFHRHQACHTHRGIADCSIQGEESRREAVRSPCGYSTHVTLTSPRKNDWTLPGSFLGA